MGLREQKQRRQRAAIIENAIALFRELGFEPVKVGAIAARCEVSDATFFNYFDSKEALLGEWAHGQVDAAVLAAGAQAGDGALRRSLRFAVRSLAGAVEREPELMREAWLRARVLPAAGRSRGRASDRDPLLDLVERARSRGEVRRDVPAEELAELLRAALVATLAHGLARGEGETGEPLPDRLGRAIDLLLDAFRKRNERVRPARMPVASAPPP